MAAKHYYVDLDMNRQKVLNFALESLASDPITGDSFSGRVFLNSTEGKLKYYTSEWNSLATEAYVTSAIEGAGFVNYSFSNGLEADGSSIYLGGYLDRVTGLALKANTITLSDNFSVGTGFDGMTTEIDSIVYQSDGKILIGGSFSSFNGVSSKKLVRLNPDGSVDSGFNVGTGFNGNSVNAVAVQSDGKILVGGYFTTYNDVSHNQIIRLNQDGSVDTSFVTGIAGVTVHTIVIQSDGKILIGGDFTSYDGSSSTNILRLNSDGSIDTSFVTGTGFDKDVEALAVQSDGKILVGGYFTTYNGSGSNYIIRLNSDGSIDTSFVIGVGFDGNVVESIVLQSDGKILVGGYFTTYNGSSSSMLIRLNSDGSVDTSLNVGTGFDSSVEVISYMPDGKILVGGFFTTYNGLTQNHFVKLNQDGSVDQNISIGTGFNNAVLSIGVHPSGKLLLGGRFTLYNSTPFYRFVRISSDGRNINEVDCSVVADSGLLEYSGNYSAFFGSRSLVDKAYVDAAVNGALLTFENGLTNTDGVVSLGGWFTSPITLGGENSFTVTLYNNDTEFYSEFYLDISPSFANAVLSAGNDTTSSSIDVHPSYVELFGSGQSFKIGDLGGYYGVLCMLTGDDVQGYFSFTDTSAEASMPLSFSATGPITQQSMRLGFQVDSHTIGVLGGTLFKGITYVSDYSANFTERSLVDKAYVDAIAQGLTPHADVRVATVANLDVIASGSGGTKTLTATTNGAISVDGIALATGERVLVKNQTTGQDNGIYVVTTVGDGATPFVLSRAEDYDGSPSSEVSAGDFIYVRVGATNAATSWALLAYNGADPILETDPLNFTIIGSVGGFTAGTGVNITSGEISVVGYTPVTGATVVRKKEFATQTISVGNNDFTHNLGTRAVKVAVYDESDYSEVVVTVSTTSENVVRVNSSIAFTGLVVVLG